MNAATIFPSGGIIRAPTGAAMDEEFPVLLDTTESDYWVVIDMSDHGICISAGCNPDDGPDVVGGPSYADLLTAIAPHLTAASDRLAYPPPEDVPYTAIPPGHDSDAPLTGGWRVTKRGLEIRIVKSGPWPVTVTTRMPIPDLLTAIAAMVAREWEGA